MKGYKALSKDMKAVYGNGMQFDLGKEYTVTGKVLICKNGFHFCKNMEYLNCGYRIRNSRIFEVEAHGDIRFGRKVYVAESIRLVRELTEKEISDYFKQNQQWMLKSTDWEIRRALADQGYGLDILVYDDDFRVRTAVARQGYRLDILLRDVDWEVRQAAAEQERRMDMLSHNKYFDVKRENTEDSESFLL